MGLEFATKTMVIRPLHIEKRVNKLNTSVADYANPPPLDLDRASMAFPSPTFSRSKVNSAGEYFAESKFDTEDPTSDNIRELMLSFSVVENWRLCHGYAINTFQATLRGRSAMVCSSAIVAQRLKRFPTIIDKLRRQKGMQLARMQDIGGLRAIVTNVKQVKKLRDNYVNCKSKKFLHELVKEQDYVSNPKKSGYRGVHLIYRYKNQQSPQYDGLLLELQIRSRLQHAWATAVETIGVISDMSLKSGQGSSEWLDFFAIVSSAFADMEKTPKLQAHQDMSIEKIHEEIRTRAASLKVVEKLHAISVVAEQISRRSRRAAGEFHLIVLSPNSDENTKASVQIWGFHKEEFQRANIEYSKIEREILNTPGDTRMAVLVSAGSLADLKKAYPNFFLDVHSFLSHIRRITTTQHSP
ncbi:RelA/SpoT domain-containing protein [Planctomicrobium sp. SH527]|uniref:RelA/SpoT domain-containing protein n=1 Tax=Planctomicrobium sp. SH527 TaxID=3448123 RepID=UPI003F5B119F